MILCVTEAVPLPSLPLRLSREAPLDPNFTGRRKTAGSPLLLAATCLPNSAPGFPN